MISDEPDEDADSLDDETLLETYLGVSALKPAAGDNATDLPDWPQRRERDLGLNLDAETLAWFKARHLDWQSTMASILRAWVAAHMRPDNQHKAETASPVHSSTPVGFQTLNTQPPSDQGRNP
jgi:uncharacterized protein (DUF4415 family)